MIQKIRNLDPVYYVLYCIFIVFLKYLYFVFSDPGLYRLLPGSIGSTTHQNEKGIIKTRVRFECQTKTFTYFECQTSF